MLEKELMEPQVIRKMEEIPVVLRTPSISSIKETKNIQGIRDILDPEVREKAVRQAKPGTGDISIEVLLSETCRNDLEGNQPRPRKEVKNGKEKYFDFEKGKRFNTVQGFILFLGVLTFFDPNAIGKCFWK